MGIMCDFHFGLNFTIGGVDHIADTDDPRWLWENLESTYIQRDTPT